MLFQEREDQRHESCRRGNRRVERRVSDPPRHPVKKISVIKNCMNRKGTYEVGKEPHRKASENDHALVLFDRHLIDRLAIAAAEGEDIVLCAGPP